MNKRSIVASFLGAMILFSCTWSQQKTRLKTAWKFEKEILLDGISPIGIVKQDSFLWISDVENNRIIKIDLGGNIIEEYSGFERPMHIAIQGRRIFIPEYTSDTIRILENGNVSNYTMAEQPDAAGGVAVVGDLVAVADFYNNRVILQRGDKIITIGKKGHNDGELYYPTDLDIHDDLLYVADAYNNRVQVFDFEGNYVKMIGWNEGIKVATGLKVTDTSIFVTDFEGNRILVYDHDGRLLQILDQNLSNPTDIEIMGDKMYVVNYSGHSMTLYDLHPR